jgi:hypothetical protein
VIEKTFKISDATGEQCHIEDAAVIGQVQELTYPLASHEGPPPNAIRKETLASLTAEVIRVNIMADDDLTTITSVKPEGLGFAYKVYLEGDTNCAEVDHHHPEQERPFNQLAAGSTIYVVVANTDHQPGSRIGYEIEVKPAPLPSLRSQAAAPPQ